jgi:sarcosine oxidase subunit alpha
LSSGSEINRSRPLAFSYDGTRYEGYAGDTLASALLANGIHLVARSFKYHRPRGIYSAGAEEPNALVQLGSGAKSEPNTRATMLELYEGLAAQSQNCWPSVGFDVGATASLFSALLPAGFYYKTFMWPPSPRWWLKYEQLIRGAAGMGRAATLADPDRYEHQYAHCDVLVIGGGPAGLAAAHAAAMTGARVIVCQQSHRFVDAKPTLDELGRLRNVTLLSRTTAFGYYDDTLVGAIERVTDHLSDPPAHLPRHRMWMIRARAVVLASGAIERGIAYAGNDRPGTMLAGAALRYVKRYGVRLGTRAVIFANNDAAYATALGLHGAGISVAAIVDPRSKSKIDAALLVNVSAAGLTLHAESIVVRARGRLRVSGIDVMPLAGSASTSIACDVVAISGGYSPTVHLFSQARGSLEYDPTVASFLPKASPLPIAAVGAANGRFSLAGAVADGTAGGLAAAKRAGFVAERSTCTAVIRDELPPSTEPLWASPLPNRRGKAFVDLQNDVTIADIALAVHEGYESVEHLKRYTTLGMGTDQGKTSNVMGLALMAQQLGVSIAEVGTTTFRPPYTPVTLGAFPGHAHGVHVEPTRYSAMHAWHEQQGARFVNAGLWKRPHSYPHVGESEDDAAIREARNVRENVGIVDVSTLGKIELQGRDVVELLNRIYINRFDTLPVGRCRYGVMLRDDGIVRDDGTTSRLDETHFLMTTTTANAAAIMQHIERLLQVDWPDLDVYATSVTENWAAAALAGPKSRDVLSRLVDTDVSDDALPFLGVVRARLNSASGPIPVRVFRISYSGELAYELHVPAHRGGAMWDAVIRAGQPLGIMPYGTEAMNTLRVEKGHIVVGSEIDGRMTAADLGMENLINPNKWCIGKPLLARSALNAPDRWQLVGLTAQEDARIPRGAKLVADPNRPRPNPMVGHVTSWCFSPNLNAWIALALVAGGRSRYGEMLWAVSPLAGTQVRVKVGPPCFIDPDGGRLRG